MPPVSELAPETESEEGNFVDPDFSELSEFVDNGEEEAPAKDAELDAAKPTEETPPVSDETQGKEEKPVEVEVKPEETPAEVPTETPPVAASEEDPPPTPTPEPEPAPEVKVPTKEEMQGMYDQFRDETLPVLEKLYAMDDDLAAAYDENPKEVLPKIAAQIHYDAMMSSYNAVMAAVPSVIGRYIKAATLANNAENEFVKAWPQLNDKKFENVVRTAVQSYRQSNPNANLADVIQKAGTLAMINAGLKLDAPVAEVKPKPAPKPAMPVSPSGQVNVEAPVVPGAGSDNVFDQLSEDWDKSQFS